MYLPLYFCEGMKWENMVPVIERICQEPFDADSLFRFIITSKFGNPNYKGKYHTMNNYISHNPKISESLFGNVINRNMWEEWEDVISASYVITEWSKSKQVYKFDNDFAKELYETEKLKIPLDMLEHLPFNTFYLDLEKIPDFEPFKGCLVRVETDEEGLHVLIYRMTEDKIYFYSHTRGIWNQMDSENGVRYIEFKKDEAPNDRNFTLSKQAQKEMGCNKSYFCKHSKDLVMFVFQAILFLAAKPEDIVENPTTKKTYRPTKVVKNRFNEIRLWDVGVCYGNAIRRAKSEVNRLQKTYDADKEKHKEAIVRNSPRPHVRRAHWQHYWTGKGRTNLIVKWKPPCYVFGNTEIPVTIHECK